MAVEAAGVDLEQVERLAGDRGGDHALAADLGVVADPLQQPVGDPRGAARALGDHAARPRARSRPRGSRPSGRRSRRGGPARSARGAGETPKRSRSGVVSRPARVVAPTSVNGGRSRVTVRAPAPWPSTIGSWRSSIAGYSVSSIARLRRWISSMKKTDPGSSAVRKAAMSALRSSAGPAVCTNGAPSSAAMMWASEVLPRPGGPGEQDVVERLLAALGRLDEDLELAVTCSWLTKSSSRRGRSERSSSSSPRRARASAIGSAAIGSSSAAAEVRDRARRSRCLPLRRRRAQRGADQLLGRLALGATRAASRPRRACSRGAEARRARARAGRPRRPGRQRRHALLELAGDLLAQLDDHPLGGALADPGDRLEALRVAGGDRAQQLARRAAGEDRDRDLGADAGDRGQVQEEVALLLGGEAVELRSSRRGRPGGRAGSRPCRSRAQP